MTALRPFGSDGNADSIAIISDKWTFLPSVRLFFMFFNRL